MSSQPSKLWTILATPAELVALNAAINFALQYAHYLPPEGKQLLTEFQQRLMRYLSFLSPTSTPTSTQTPLQKEPQRK